MYSVFEKINKTKNTIQIIILSTTIKIFETLNLMM